MAKTEERIESIYNIKNFLVKDKLLPIYFLFGEDEFAIDKAIDLIKNKLSEYVLSEFDIEIIDSANNVGLNSIIDLANAFPLGGGKKIIIIKDFEKDSTSKELLDYIVNPSEFTFLVISQKTKKVDLREKLFQLLIEKGYLFEARSMNRRELVNWVISTAAKYDMKITQQNAEVLIDFAGNDKSILSMNLLKFSNLLINNGEITIEVIEKLGSSGKEYTGLNLLNAIINNNKSEALEIADLLFEKTDDKSILGILGLLTRFVSTAAKIIQLESEKINVYEASKRAGVSSYFYENCKKAVHFRNPANLKVAIDALLEAEMSIKTSSLDSKTIMMTLIARMIPKQF